MHSYHFPQALYMYLLYRAVLLGSIFVYSWSKGTCSFVWFTVVVRDLSLNWAISLVSWKKFYKSEDNWFLVYLFEAGMKLRFLFRNLYVSKENECFDQFTASPNGLDLYLSVFVIVRCSLKVFALFLERNSVSSTDRCWFEYGLLMWRPSDFQLEMFFLILSVFSLLCVSCSFCFVSKIYDSSCWWFSVAVLCMNWM